MTFPTLPLAFVIIAALVLRCRINNPPLPPMEIGKATGEALEKEI